MGPQVCQSWRAAVKLKHVSFSNPHIRSQRPVETPGLVRPIKSLLTGHVCMFVSSATATLKYAVWPSLSHSSLREDLKSDLKTLMCCVHTPRPTTNQCGILQSLKRCTNRLFSPIGRASCHSATDYFRLPWLRFERSTLSRVNRPFFYTVFYGILMCLVCRPPAFSVTLVQIFGGAVWCRCVTAYV